jgi:hypothetical protein
MITVSFTKAGQFVPIILMLRLEQMEQQIITANTGF